MGFPLLVRRHLYNETAPGSKGWFSPVRKTCSPNSKWYVSTWASTAVVSLVGLQWCAMSFTELVQIRFWRMGDGRLVKHAGYSCGWLRCSLVRPFLSIDPFTKTIPNKVAFKIMPRPGNVSDKMPSVRPRYQIYILGKVLVVNITLRKDIYSTCQKKFWHKWNRLMRSLRVSCFWKWCHSLPGWSCISWHKVIICWPMERY